MGNYKSIDGPGTLFMMDGVLMKVTGYWEGGRVICSQPVVEEVCECCGRVIGYRHDLENSPNFQNHVQPVKTLKT